MPTVIRPVLTKGNKYYIPKHRYYELKHFCLQKPKSDEGGDLIRECCREADEFIWNYIWLAVSDDLSFTTLQTLYGIPCGKDYYYDKYRKFFWLLSNNK